MATVILVAITGYYACVNQGLLRSQVEPVVDFELSQDRTQIVIGNLGAYRVVDVRVQPESTVFLGPPLNQPVMRVITGPVAPGSKPAGWWNLGTLDPNETQRHPITDAVESALNDAHWMDLAKKSGSLGGVPPDTKAQIFAFIVFRLTFHREFDHRRYTVSRIAYVARDPNTGQPIVWNAEPAFGRMEQMVKSLK